MTKRIKTQNIRTRTNAGDSVRGTLYAGDKASRSYLSIPYGTGGIIRGRKLYRLAKAIVRRFEAT
jgi:hypothetical protein